MMCLDDKPILVRDSGDKFPQSSWVDPAHDAVAWRRPLVLLMACTLIAVLASTNTFQASIHALLTTLRPTMQHHPLTGSLVLIAAAAISAMAAFVSVAALVPAAVFVWGEWSTILMLWIGWILGGLLAYALAWCLGRRVIGWFGARNLLQRCETWVGADAPFVLILALQLTLPSEIPGYLLGLVRYPVGKYMIALALAELPYALITVYLGHAFLEQRSGVILIVGAIAVISSALAATWLRRATRGRV